MCWSFFFFQAEDGIRDRNVTGVQTCALPISGKTGTAQSGTRKNGVELNHAWFVGFAPADQPQIVVAVMLEFGGHGTRAANIASAIIAHYLHSNITSTLQTEG